MEKVTSKDGTQIAYDRQGTGPALILVDGALCYRSFGPMPGLDCEALMGAFSFIAGPAAGATFSFFRLMTLK